jgi:5-deoxy-glucuronate isomerase
MTQHDPSQWKRRSPTAPGLHAVATPENSPFRSSHIFRLNLAAGQSHDLGFPDLELVGSVITGSVTVSHGPDTERLARCDSFYMPGGDRLTLTAHEDAVLYLGGGACEGIGTFYVRPLDLDMPIGPIHQVHGEPPYEREVFMSVDPDTPASRLIAGLTWGADARWTSWPPHQHEKDLEETYCYFDIPAGKAAFHFSYLQDFSEAAVHTMSSGDFALAPVGYHPTVAPPTVRSTYMWILVAHSHESRSYDLAVSDPRFGD